MNNITEGIIIASNFFVVLFALYYNIKVLRDKTKKDYVLPWKFIFMALIFFLIFEIIGVFNSMGLLNLWGLNEKAQIAYGISRLGILACFLFGLILEDQHEIVEEKHIVAKMKQTRKENEAKKRKVGRYSKRKKK
jgi:uncharacterized metal-binding protein